MSDIGSLSQEEILNKIKNAGIVGLGGATFPTHVKLKPPPDKKIDHLILNGCECEPWITSDHRTMLEHGQEIISGLKIMLKALPVEKAYIAIETNKQDAIDHLEELLGKSGLGSQAEGDLLAGGQGEVR